MILTAVEQVANDRKILGTVNATDGLVNLHFNSVNLANASTAVYFDLELTDGKTIRVFCSKAVSTGVRAKEITKDNLYGFPITNATTKGGIEYYRVEMPEGVGSGHRITIDVKTLTVANYIAKAVSYEELIA